MRCEILQVDLEASHLGRKFGEGFFGYQAVSIAARHSAYPALLNFQWVALQEGAGTARMNLGAACSWVEVGEY
jgi:hypothetical protein